jgi:hypothetical protein
MVAFDRFLARLMREQPDAWIVKGGFALQLWLGGRARTTKDIDVSAVNPWTRDQTIAHLRAVVSLELGDWFEFEVGEPAEAATGAPGVDSVSQFAVCLMTASLKLSIWTLDMVVLSLRLRSN